jgi:hypothetical protein
MGEHVCDPLDEGMSAFSRQTSLSRLSLKIYITDATFGYSTTVATTGRQVIETRTYRPSSRQYVRFI